MISFVNNRVKLALKQKQRLNVDNTYLLYETITQGRNQTLFLYHSIVSPSFSIYFFAADVTPWLRNTSTWDRFQSPENANFFIYFTII